MDCRCREASFAAKTSLESKKIKVELLAKDSKLWISNYGHNL